MAATTEPTLVAIKDNPAPTNAALLLDRCEDFARATTIYAQILASNPVHGRDSTRKAPFEWANGLLLNIHRRRNEAPRAHDSVVNAYMEAFGPVALPTVVPNLALYQDDKDTCLTHFGDQDEYKE